MVFLEYYCDKKFDILLLLFGFIDISRILIMLLIYKLLSFNYYIRRGF